MALTNLTVVQQALVSQVGVATPFAVMEGSAAMFMTPIIKYNNKITEDTNVTSDAPTAVMYIDRDMMVDIEDGITVTVDDGCSFSVIEL